MRAEGVEGTACFRNHRRISLTEVVLGVGSVVVWPEPAGSADRPQTT